LMPLAASAMLWLTCTGAEPSVNTVAAPSYRSVE
jgi:hypothetical protein